MIHAPGQRIGARDNGPLHALDRSAIASSTPDDSGAKLIAHRVRPSAHQFNEGGEMHAGRHAMMKFTVIMPA